MSLSLTSPCVMDHIVVVVENNENNEYDIINAKENENEKKNNKKNKENDKVVFENIYDIYEEILKMMDNYEFTNRNSSKILDNFTNRFSTNLKISNSESIWLDN